MLSRAGGSCAAFHFFGDQIATDPCRTRQLGSPLPRIFQANIAYTTERKAPHLTGSTNSVSQIPGFDTAGGHTDS